MKVSRTKLALWVGIPGAILVAILGFQLAYNAANPGNNAQGVGGNTCPPTSLSAIKVASNFIVRQPTVLPDHYTLQGIEDEQPADIQFLYANHTLCSFPSGFDYHANQLKVVIAKPGTPTNSTKFQKDWLNYAANPKNGIVAKVVPLDINGNNGVGWEQYDTNSTVRLDGKVIQSTPYHGQAALFFYNDKNNMVYSIFGNDNQTLGQLEDVARSIR
jgi:hypothetical protein